MTEEKQKQGADKEGKEQAPKAEKEPKKAPRPAEAEVQEVPSSSGGDKKRKHPKVTHMSLSQVEKALENTRKQMGGYQSRHARNLLARKAVLAGQGGVSLPKAA